MIYILASTNPLDHIIGVLIFLVSNIYHIAAWAFEVFLVLSTGQILDSEKYSLIIQNFYIVLGVVLLFFLSFSLLKGIVDPDDNKQGGSVIKTSIINLVTSVIMLALLPTIFGFLYDFQTSFITKYNVIGRFFGYGNLGTPTSTKDTDYICQMDNESIKQGAFQITNGVFTAFFNVNSEKCSTKVNSLESLKNCQNDVTPKDDILFITWSSSRPSFYETVGRVDRNGFFSSYIDFSTNVREGDISFNFILSLIAGLLLIYVGISYSLDMALRMVKLVFYQIIAPIPIFARVVPDGPLKGSFEKWLKIVLACYLEVYIRILSFYFVVYLCVAMLDSSYIGNIFLCFNPVVGLLTRAFLLMGMVMFMKQAPKLIGDATGLDTGNMKLGIREKLKDGGFFTAGAAVGSSITSGVRNYINARKNGESKWKAFGSAIGGGAAGIYHGGKAGWKAASWSDMKSSTVKGAQAAADARDKRAAYKAVHPGKYGVLKGHINDFKKSTIRYFNDESIEGLTRESQNMEKISSRYGAFNDTIERMLESEQAKGEGSAFLGNGFNLHYKDFDTEAKKLAEVTALFNAGRATSDQLEAAKKAYSDARDVVRDEIMDIALKGRDGKEYKALSEKGQAVLKDSLVNAQSLQATIIENANSKVVQDIMGANGNGTLANIVNGIPIDHSAFEYTDSRGNKSKLKDAAKVAQGQADIKIAELNKDQAAKGDNK